MDEGVRDLQPLRLDQRIQFVVNDFTSIQSDERVARLTPFHELGQEPETRTLRCAKQLRAGRTGRTLTWDHLGPDLQTFQFDEFQRCRCETTEEPKAGSGRTSVRSEPVTRGASGAHQERKRRRCSEVLRGTSDRRRFTQCCVSELLLGNHNN